MSAPASNSLPRSGLSESLPGLPGMAPELADAPGLMAYAAATRVVSASPGFGERPVVPYAARTRIVGMYAVSGAKNFSSDTVHVAPIFGSTNAGAELPNDEFLSTRTPTCTNARFW